MDDDDEELDQVFNELLSRNNPPSTTQPPQPATTTRVPNPRPSPGNQSQASGAAQQPTPQALPRARASPSAILVSKRQRGNPILNNVKLVPWEYADIPADYVVGRTTCVLFLSLKYHRLHPEYIYTRIRMLAGKYELRVLLTVVDIPDHEASLKELSKTSLVNNLTLILAWSAPEAGHYLELFKTCENTTGAAIRAQQPQSYKDSLVEFVTVPRSINKSDAASLIASFGSLRAAINAAPEVLANVPGWGETKVRQWCAAVQEDFRVEKTKRRTAAVSIPTRTVKTATHKRTEEKQSAEGGDQALEGIENDDGYSNQSADQCPNTGTIGGSGSGQVQTVGDADYTENISDDDADDDDDGDDDDLLVAIRNARVEKNPNATTDAATAPAAAPTADDDGDGGGGGSSVTGENAEKEETVKSQPTVDTH